jgi:photosystem II stability/assembly factor-like uncharacterized protein
MCTFPKRLLALTLFAALAAMPTRGLRAQWVQTNGPNGGTIQQIIVSGPNIYVGVNSGVFLSINNGTNWNSFRLSGNVVQNIGGCGTYLFAWTQDSFYVSTSNGSTWTEDSNRIGSKNYGFNNFAQIGPNIFAAGAGVYRSTDNGISWTSLSTNLPNRYIDGLAVSNNILYVFLAAGIGVFRSTDNGESWTAANHGLPYDSTSSDYSTLNAIQTMGTNLFVETISGVYLSTDSGNNYTLDTVMPMNVWSLTVNGTNLFSTTYDQGIFLSTDSGTSWTQYAQGSYINKGSSIAVVGSDIIVGTNNGIYHSNDADTSGILVGLQCLPIYSFFGSGNNLYADDADDYISTDEVLSWDGTDTVPVLVFGSIIVARGFSNTGSEIIVSTNNGVSWIQAGLPSTMGYPSFVKMGKYLFASTDRFTFDETDTDVFRSSDSGKTWTVVCTVVQPQAYGWLLPLTGNRLLYGGSSDDEHFLAYLSDDYGESWQFVDSTLLTSSNTSYIPFGLCYHPPTPDAQIGTITFGVDSGVLYRSSDDGTTWELMNVDSLNDSLTGINSAAATGNDLFVCAKSGNVFLSTDTGVTWKNVNDGLVDSSISFLAVTGQYLFAANANDSFWRRPLGDFGIAAVTQVNPLQNSLKSYPNPLSQSTEITFTLPEASEVTLTISDATGRETPLLRSAWFPAGQHEISWDASNYASGVYLCRLTSGGESISERVVVLK